MNMSEKLESMKYAKIESKSPPRLTILTYDDKVKFTASTKDGEVIRTSTGTIVDMTIITASSVKYWIHDNNDGKTYEVMVGSTSGWYSNDSVVLIEEYQKEIKYFAVYDSRTNSVLKDSIYTYRQDTVDYLTGRVGANAPDYLKIREITIIVPVE